MSKLYRCDSFSSSNESESDETDTEFPIVKTSQFKTLVCDDSPAVVERLNEQRDIDDHFEHLYKTEYAEEFDAEAEKIDDDKNEANRSLIDQNNCEHFRALVGEDNKLEERFPRTLPDAEWKNAILRYVDAKESQVQESEETEKILLPTENAKRARWDCESIVSTYSTIYNHPTEIRESSNPTAQNRNKRKLNTRSTNSDVLNNLEEQMDIGQDYAQSIRSSRVSTASTFRPKNETPEERRVRKQAIKEERRERRQEKKANRIAFHQQKLAMDAQKHTATMPNVRTIH